MQTKNCGPLAGVKILDLTCVLSGPFGTSWLSDMGAEVIKVENPNGGDYTRQAGPFVNGPDVPSTRLLPALYSRRHTSLDSISSLPCSVAFG